MSAEIEQGAVPLRVISRQGLNYVVVDDVAALLHHFAGVVDGKPQPAAEVLRMIAGSFDQGSAEQSPGSSSPTEPPAQPCPGCGVRVQTYGQIDPSQPDVTLNAAPTPYGGWMVTRARERVIAIRYDVRQHSRLGIARFREHQCNGPFAGKAGTR